jgi:hypothetical protein
MHIKLSALELGISNSYLVAGRVSEAKKQFIKEVNHMIIILIFWSYSFRPINNHFLVDSSRTFFLPRRKKKNHAFMSDV